MDKISSAIAIAFLGLACAGLSACDDDGSNAGDGSASDGPPSVTGDGGVDTNIGNGQDAAPPDTSAQADTRSVDGPASSMDVAASDANVDGNPGTLLAPGVLDPGFADGGVALVPLTGGSAAFRDVQILAGGDLLLAGGANSKMVLARFHGDGQPDSTFGTAGVLIPPVAEYSAASVVRARKDGKFVAAGQGAGADRDFALVRFDRTGTLDSAFGNAGILLTDFGSGRGEAANAMFLLPDDGMIVGGYANNGTDDDLALARYDATGALVSGFGNGGLVTLPVLTGDDRINDVTVDASRRILVAGYTSVGNDRDFVVVRFSAGGSLDTTFATNGIFRLPDVPVWSEARSVAVLGSAVWIAGSTNDKATLVRLDGNGALDATFGTNGVATLGKTGSFVYKLLLAASGDAVVLGSARLMGGGTVAEAIRISPTGSLVPTFGDGGFLDLDLGTGDSDIWFGGGLDASNRIVAVGWSKRLLTGNTWILDAVVARFGW